MENQQNQNLNTPLPVQPAIPPTSEPKKDRVLKSKWLILGIVAVVLIAGIGSAYLLGKNNAGPKPATVAQAPTFTPTPTPDPTANWKTYTNSNYDFAFQYPNYLSTFNDKFPKKIPSIGTVSDELRISSADYKNDLQIYINSHFGGMCNGTLIYDAKRSDSSLSFTRTKGDNSNLPTGATCSSFYEAKIDLGDGNYLNTNFSYDSKNTNAQADFEKILSTFKFANSNNETASWITYTSVSEPTLSFKYPSSWTATKSSISPAPNNNPNVPQELEKLDLISKNGTKISFDVGGNNIGGACSDTAINTINQTIPLKNAKGLNLIDIAYPQGSGSYEIMGIDSSSPKIGSISDCSTPHLIFNGKLNPNLQIIFTSTVTTLETDKQEATQILESLRY